MLLGRESGEDGNEAMDLIGAEEETAAVAPPVEWEGVGWGMDIVTGVGPPKPDEMVQCWTIKHGKFPGARTEGFSEK